MAKITPNLRPGILGTGGSGGGGVPPVGPPSGGPGARGGGGGYKGSRHQSGTKKQAPPADRGLTAFRNRHYGSIPKVAVVKPTSVAKAAVIGGAVGGAVSGAADATVTALLDYPDRWRRDTGRTPGGGGGTVLVPEPEKRVTPTPDPKKDGGRGVTVITPKTGINVPTTTTVNPTISPRTEISSRSGDASARVGDVTVTSGATRINVNPSTMSEGGRGGQGGQGGRGGSATSSNDARFYGGNYSYEVGPTNVSPIINNQVQVGLGGLANAIQQAAGQDAVGSIAPNSIGDCTKMLEMASAQGNPAEWIATHAPYCAGAGFDPTN